MLPTPLYPPTPPPYPFREAQVSHGRSLQSMAQYQGRTSLLFLHLGWVRQPTKGIRFPKAHSSARDRS